MCAVRVYWQNKDFAMESWHNVFGTSILEKLRPTCFLVAPTEQEVQQSVLQAWYGCTTSRMPIGPRDLQTYGAQDEKYIMRHCALCLCILNVANLWTCLGLWKPAQCLLPLCPRWRSASWARAKGWWIYDERLLMKDSSKSLHTKTTLSKTLPWPTSPSHLAKQSGDETRNLWKVTRNRRPSVHHVALAHRVQDVPRVSCDSLCLKMSKKSQDFYSLKIDGTSLYNCILNGLFLTVFFVLTGRASQMHSFHSTFLCEFCVLVWLLVL